MYLVLYSQMSDTFRKTYPRKGTETIERVIIGNFFIFRKTYPRKGTETAAFLSNSAFIVFHLEKHFPVRGRKPSVFPFYHCIFLIEKNISP